MIPLTRGKNVVAAINTDTQDVNKSGVRWLSQKSTPKQPRKAKIRKNIDGISKVLVQELHYEKVCVKAAVITVPRFRSILQSYPDLLSASKTALQGSRPYLTSALRADVSSLACKSTRCEW